MQDRLAGKRFALVFIGSVDGTVRANVEQAVEDAAGAPARLRALKVPIEEVQVRAALRGVPDAPQSLPEIGRALAAELLDGGDTPLWDALGDLLVEEREGGMQLPVDGIVVARSADPQRGPTARLDRKSVV